MLLTLIVKWVEPDIIIAALSWAWWVDLLKSRMALPTVSSVTYVHTNKTRTGCPLAAGLRTRSLQVL